jgi:hypothetical protein
MFAVRGARGVLIVFHGLEVLPLATRPGLPVSFNKELGNLFVGNLIS